VTHHFADVDAGPAFSDRRYNLWTDNGRRFGSGCHVKIQEQVLCGSVTGSGGKYDGSVMPRTKLEAQWCPAGLTGTQKWRVHRILPLKINGEHVSKIRDKMFNKTKPIISTKKV
jgi:hypothetical protein